jgi:hypothetical protein
LRRTSLGQQEPRRPPGPRHHANEHHEQDDARHPRVGVDGIPRRVAHDADPLEAARTASRSYTNGCRSRQRLLSRLKNQRAQRLFASRGATPGEPGGPGLRHRASEIVPHGRACARRRSPPQLISPDESTTNDCKCPTHVKHFGRIRASLRGRSPGGACIRDGACRPMRPTGAAPAAGAGTRPLTSLPEAASRTLSCL